MAPSHPFHGPYHDREYGFPARADDVLFERLVLEINQAGLSWLTVLKKRALAQAEEVFKQAGRKVDFLIGTMIEIPRAALTADEVALEAEFFSFGTNDLTQMGFGFSRDDIGSFLPHYLDKKILPADPFQTIDQEGIGELVKMAITKGRSVKPHLKVGICGEQGGDPESVKFCFKVGLSYVSCSPFRVPLARLAAAQAAISAASEKKAPVKKAPAKKAPAAKAKPQAKAKPAAKAAKKAAKKPAAHKRPVLKAAKGKGKK